MIHRGETRPEDRGDEALVEACLKGDESAWSTLIERYAGLVHGLARRAGLDPDDAADAAQAVFLIAWRNLGLLDRPGALGGWLATITRREAWRLKRRRERERGEELPSGDVAQPARVEREMLAAERRHWLERGIERLGERCRTLLELLFLRRPPATYEEVAEALDMPIGSIGPTRGRCLEKLRDVLTDLAPGVFSGDRDASAGMETR